MRLPGCIDAFAELYGCVCGIVLIGICGVVLVSLRSSAGAVALYDDVVFQLYRGAQMAIQSV